MDLAQLIAQYFSPGMPLQQDDAGRYMHPNEAQKWKDIGNMDWGSVLFANPSQFPSYQDFIEERAHSMPVDQFLMLENYFKSNPVNGRRGLEWGA